MLQKKIEEEKKKKLKVRRLGKKKDLVILTVEEIFQKSKMDQESVLDHLQTNKASESAGQLQFFLTK